MRAINAAHVTDYRLLLLARMIAVRDAMYTLYCSKQFTTYIPTDCVLFDEGGWNQFAQKLDEAIELMAKDYTIVTRKEASTL